EPLFAELEFRTLGRRVFGEDFNINDSKLQEGAQIELFSEPRYSNEAMVQPTENTAEVGKNINNTEHDYRVAQTIEEIEELILYLNQQKAICFDTETTGIDANCCDLVGLSFAVEIGKAWYVPLAENRDECI